MNRFYLTKCMYALPFSVQKRIFGFRFPLLRKCHFLLQRSRYYNKKIVPHIPAKLSWPLFLYSDVNKTSRRLNHNNTLFFFYCVKYLYINLFQYFLTLSYYNLILFYILHSIQSGLVILVTPIRASLHKNLLKHPIFLHHLPANHFSGVCLLPPITASA